MKKFLFTLAALMMAGSLCAEEYFFIDNIELTKEEAAAGCKKIAYVKAHFDNAVSAWQVDLTLPEGVTIDVAQPAADMTLTYLDKFTDEETMDEYYAENTYTPALANANGYTRFIVSVFTTVEYDEAGNSYGICWRPGDYDAMWRVRLVFPAGFEGGDITVTTQPSCGETIMAGLTPCPKGQVNEHVTNVTVEGGEEPEVTEAPVITYNEETYTVTATGNGEVKLYVNGVEVENPYTFEQTEEEVTYTVTATAQEAGKEISETATATIVVPAKAVEPPVTEQTEKPVITSEDDADLQVVHVTATGNGHICLYWDDQLMAEGNGTATWDIPYGEDPEGEEYGVSATAQEEGKLVSDYALATIFVPGKEVTPQDPHAEGMWLVLIDKNGEPVYVELTSGQGAQVALDYPTYGGYNAEMDPENPDVRYYFLIDGVRYGAEVEDDVTNMGDMAQTLQNPLVEGENCYVIPTGYNYLIGVYVASDGSMFVMCAQAGFTGIDELVNGKTVAGVRYFNMAGQEMQEANGVTIVVTTYTDGTTTAVKVIK